VVATGLSKSMGKFGPSAAGPLVQPMSSTPIPIVVCLAAAALTDCGSGSRDRRTDGQRDAKAFGVCSEDRIRKLYAVPGSVVSPLTTTVEVEVFDDAVVGDAAYSFAIRRDAEAQGEVALSQPSFCARDSVACQDVTCLGIGNSTQVDAITDLPKADVRIEITVEDEACRETEELWIGCLQAGAEDTCTLCIRMIDAEAAAAVNSDCLGRALLDAVDPTDRTKRGCVDDEACFDLWTCQQRSLCHLPVASACYCGELEDPADCEDPSFEPRGPCREEALAAFEAQFLARPDDNAHLLRELFNVADAPSGFALMATANVLASECLLPDGYEGRPTTRGLLEASGLSDAAVDLCMNACLPPR